MIIDRVGIWQRVGDMYRHAPKDVADDTELVYCFFGNDCTKCIVCQVCE